MAAKIPGLAGMSPWILKDFRSPRRQHPVFQQGWNRKGLISETGQRKQAFDVLAGFYRDMDAKRR
jgi:beta-glucuronidase